MKPLSENCRWRQKADHLIISDSILLLFFIPSEKVPAQRIKDEIFLNYGYMCKSHGKKKGKKMAKSKPLILSLLMVSICMLEKITYQI